MPRADARRPPDLAHEAACRAAGHTLVAGVDEAGRGCLAGPVVAAAVILKPGAALPGLRDSKLLSAPERERQAALVRDQALAVGLGVCSPAEIDRLNILRAALEAMRRAVAALCPAPACVLTDGCQPAPGLTAAQITIVGGDRVCLSIAAASVLAKTHRDALMRGLDAEHPGYEWARNKGYPTAAHYEALRRLGPTAHHRRSFRLA